MAPIPFAAPLARLGAARLACCLLVILLTTPGFAAVSNVTFTLEKTGSNANVTDMWVGTTVSFKLTVEFPIGTTDMLIELFAPDNDTIIMALCNVQVSVGSDLSSDVWTGSVVMDSLNGSLFHDRAIADFGNVSYTNGGSANTIVITYDATMIHNDQTQNGTTYWVSAGAEYKNEDEVWVGQAAFTAHTDGHLSTTTPVFNMTGPDKMHVGSAAVFSVDMYIPHPSAYISFDAFAPINTTNVMSVVGVKVKDTGANYECLFKADDHVQTLHQDSNTKGWARGHLDLGVMTNRGNRDRTSVTADDRITVDFVVWLELDAPVGENFWVGGAVELGDSQIWCGQMQVTTLDRYDTPNVVPQLYVTGAGALSAEVPLSVQLEIELPVNSTSDYKLEVLAPMGSGQAILKVCSLSLVKVGENTPATTLEGKEAEYTSREGGTVADRAVLDLLRVSNVGDWGHQNATVNADNNRLSFSLIVLAASNHSSVVNSAAFSLTVGLVINTNTVSVGTVDVTIDTSLTAPQNTTQPLWQLEYAFGDDNIKIGSATNMQFTITTTANHLYSPFDLEIIMPNASSEIPFRICSLRILSAGKNLPCVQPKLLNNAVSYHADYDVGGDYDRAVFKMEGVCNAPIVNSTDEDKLVVSAIVQATGAATAGDTYWLSAGVMYSSTRMWIGQLAATATSAGSWDTTAPEVYLVVNTTETTIYQGYGKVYTLHIKIPMGIATTIVVGLDSTAADISLCDLRLVAVGASMPCVDLKAQNATYTKDTATGKVSAASLDLGVITNAGTENGTEGWVFDDNTIQIQFMAKALATAATGDISFTATVTYPGGSITLNPNMTIDTNPLNVSTPNISTVDMSIGPISGSDTSNNVAIGEAKRVLVDLFMPQDSDQPCQELEVKMLSPLNTYGLVEVAYIGLLDAGENFNCFHRSQTTASYLKRPHNDLYQDIGSLTLGVVCNSGLSADPLANRVRVEVVVRVLRNESTAVGSDITLSAGISTNKQQILMVQTNLHVVDNFTDHFIDNVTLVNGTGLRLNVSDGTTLSARPGDVITLPVTLFVPLYSVTLAQFDLECPLNTSAYCTFVDFRASSSGINLARWGYPEDYKVTTASSMNTTQNDRAFVDMGILTNSGSTDRIGENKVEDNAVSVEVDVKVADALPMENGTEMWVSLGLKVAKFIVILDVKVVIERDGTEKPVLLCQADVDIENSTSEYIEVDVTLQHDNASRAECQNATAMIYLPPYLAFHSVVAANLTPATAVQANGAVLLDYGSLYFTDVVALTLAFMANSTARMPEVISGARSVVTMETVCNMYHREGSQYAEVEDFCSDMCHVNFTATVTKESGLSCTSSALGLETAGNIQDCQLSSSAYSITPATKARLNGDPAGWAPFVREGSLAALRCLQVCLGHKAFVDKLAVQQSGPSNASRLATLFSDDGRAWVQGEEVTLDPTAESQVVALNQPAAARYVRLCVLQDTDPTQRLGLRFELYGCNPATTMAASDRCTFCSAVPSAPVMTAEFSPRSFLVAGTAASPDSFVLVCDGSSSSNTNANIESACFKADIVPVAGAVWKELDPRLDCVVGYDTETHELYGTSQGGAAVLISSDSGLTWNATRPEKLAETKAKVGGVFKAAVKVPWTGEAGLTFDGITPTGGNLAYRDSAGKVLGSFGGLWFFDSAWSLALNWTTCCS